MKRLRWISSQAPRRGAGWRRQAGRAAALAAALAAAVAPVAPSAGATPQARSAYAITGATVITAPGNTIENATVVIRDGLIEAVGAGVNAPPDARLIDGTGMTVFAGWIDGFSEVAIEPEATETGEAPGRGGGGRGGGQQALQMLELGAPGVNQQVRSSFDQADHINGEDEQIAGFRNAGFTAALVVPQDGIYRGKSVLIALRQAAPADIVVREDVAQVVGFSSGGFGRGYPSSLMGVISLIRQVLLDTQRQATWENSYNNDPTGIPRPDANPAYAALQPLLRGEQPVIFDANNTRNAKRALEIAQEFGLDPIIRGNGNEYEMVETLADSSAGLIIPVEYPDAPAVSEDADANLDVSLADLQRWEEAAGNAAALEAAGLAFAFTADGIEPADFAVNVRKAIEAGLSEEAALAAVTTVPARLFGVEAIVGTLEPGKIANLVVATGRPFAEGTEVRHVFIDGIDHQVEAQAAGLGGRGGAGEDGLADPRGAWSVRMGNGDFSQRATWRIAGGDAFSAR
jgi:imidazolonepropionase-like amidohydrolase